MKEGHWQRHLRKIRTKYRKKHNLMKEHLKKNLKNSKYYINKNYSIFRCFIIFIEGKAKAHRYPFISF